MGYVFNVCGILTKPLGTNQDSTGGPLLRHDILSLLLFRFFQKAYYLDAEIPFPNSKEKAGSFIGIAENVGDAMTFWIWTKVTEKLIARSVIRDAQNPKNANKTVHTSESKDQDEKSPPSMQMEMMLT